MNKILIITTEGCEACTIAERNIDIAMMQTSKEITKEVVNHKKLDKQFLRKNRVTDFPAVIYITNDVIVHRCCGTYPSSVYLRWIDVYFKF